MQFFCLFFLLFLSLSTYWNEFGKDLRKINQLRLSLKQSWSRPAAKTSNIWLWLFTFIKAYSLSYLVAKASNIIVISSIKA